MFKTYAHTVFKALQWCRNVMTVPEASFHSETQLVMRDGGSCLSVQILCTLVSTSACLPRHWNDSERWGVGASQGEGNASSTVLEDEFLSKARFPKRMRGERTFAWFVKSGVFRAGAGLSASGCKNRGSMTKFSWA